MSETVRQTGEAANGVEEVFDPLQGLVLETDYEGKEVLHQDENGDKTVRYLVDPSDSLPRDPLYATVWEEGTGKSLFLQQLSSERGDKRAVHLLRDTNDPSNFNEGDIRTYIAVDDNEKGTFHLVGVQEDQVQRAFRSPIGFIESLQAKQ